MKEIIDNVIEEFCIEFINDPYIARTEHSLHAHFYARLYHSLPEKDRYFHWEGNKICAIQKEYPTASNLEKSKRQNWDISIIKTPPEVVKGRNPPYDYFKLHAAIEFGMNEEKEHLVEDIRRLKHKDSNIELKRIVHLYRISEKFSDRDWSPRYESIMSLSEIEACQKDDVHIHFAQVDSTGKHENGYWYITADGVRKIA